MNINNTMANKFQRFLGQVALGFLEPKGNMADFQHASRLYVDDTFRLAPKTKFLYYVVFNVNPDAMTDISFKDRHKLELNYLVKSADLPKYSFKTENLNQYNRKTTAYTAIQYEPVNLTLHDDNNGITNTLWALYYGYYIADRSNSYSPDSDTSPTAYERNTYFPKSMMPFRYGLDNESDAPFFNSIQLFTLSRQRFFSYLLCNPKITKWDHDTVDQSDGRGVLENKMTIAYDSVIYNSGVVQEDDPAGFAVLHYDKTPSPIANEEILQDGIAGVFGDVFSINSLSGGRMMGGLVGGILNGVLNNISPYTNTGNRAPYGYGQPTFYNPRSSLGSNSGFQQYGFGNGNAQLAALTVAGVGLATKGLGNIISGVGSLFSNSNGSTIAQDRSKTVETPNGETPAASDAFGPPAPTEAQLAQEKRYAEMDAADQEEGAAMRAAARADAADREDQEQGAAMRQAARDQSLDDADQADGAAMRQAARDAEAERQDQEEGAAILNREPSAGEEPITNDTQDIIDAQTQFQGNDEFSVGSAWG
jgi:hypothetical protein